ncbi:MAG: hypothetical protein ABJJ12_07095, partial [Marinomonas sp.]
SLVLGASLAACTQFPALDHTVTAEAEAAEYPTLVPIAQLLASAQVDSTDPVQTTAAIDARLAALRARAERLRGSVLTGREKQRLAQGLR